MMQENVILGWVGLARGDINPGAAFYTVTTSCFICTSWRRRFGREISVAKYVGASAFRVHGLKRRALSTGCSFKAAWQFNRGEQASILLAAFAPIAFLSCSRDFPFQKRGALERAEFKALGEESRAVCISVVKVADSWAWLRWDCRLPSMR